MADEGQYLDVVGLAVPLAGGLRETGDPWAPFELADAVGAVVAPAAEYLKDVQACGRSDATLRSYGMDLLRWFRFCWAAVLEWDQVTRTEARDFCRWLLIAGKPGADGGYAAATAVHCETVLRHFYDFHLDAGTGPMVNPFPLARGRACRPGAHRNPMDPFPRGRAGRFRPRVPQRAPRSIPEGQFSELFARLGSHRDRALVAFWVSTGFSASARASCSGLPGNWSTWTSPSSMWESRYSALAASSFVVRPRLRPPRHRCPSPTCALQP